MSRRPSISNPYDLGANLDDAMPRSAKRSQLVDYFLLQEPQGAGQVVGSFAGRMILEWMTDLFGRRYRYVGIAPRLRDGRYDVDALRPGEWLVEPGLIYASEPPRRRSI